MNLKAKSRLFAIKGVPIKDRIGVLDEKIEILKKRHTTLVATKELLSRGRLGGLRTISINRKIRKLEKQIAKLEIKKGKEEAKLYKLNVKKENFDYKYNKALKKEKIKFVNNAKRGR